MYSTCARACVCDSQCRERGRERERESEQSWWIDAVERLEETRNIKGTIKIKSRILSQLCLEIMLSFKLTSRHSTRSFLFSNGTFLHVM
jgi:hypothetical protein